MELYTEITTSSDILLGQIVIDNNLPTDRPITKWYQFKSPSGQLTDTMINIRLLYSDSPVDNHFSHSYYFFTKNFNVGNKKKNRPCAKRICLRTAYFTM